jgi:membrane fusion protein (multidrug efflux system)
LPARPHRRPLSNIDYIRCPRQGKECISRAHAAEAYADAQLRPAPAIAVASKRGVYHTLSRATRLLYEITCGAHEMRKHWEADMRLAVYAGLLICGFAAAPAHSQQQEAPAVPVGTVKAERKAVEKTADFVGRVEAVNRVQIRARVNGYLDAVLFKEGDLITEAAKLYRIEKDLFQAAVEQAQGALERSKGALTLAALQRQRAEDLLAKSAGTVVARDQAIAQEQQANGAVLSDEAALQSAKINLGYTDITAPIAGRIGRTNVTKGNVVGPDSGVLTTIVSQDPMYVSFPVSEREFLKAQEENHKVDVKGIKVRIRFADGTIYDQLGEINFVDVSVDRSTDTVLIRATMPNPSDVLIDGQFVHVNVQGGKPQEKIVIPQAALITDQEGVYVFIVEDGKAVVKRLKLGDQEGTGVVVDSGLSGGELVVVEGLQALRPGLRVLATPVRSTLDRS